jgi:Ca2+-binding RTX toxin-like protein
MRRITLLLATMTFALVVAGGVAFAATITCDGVSTCDGTPGDDRIKGSNTDDSINGLGGNDTIDGNGGSDIVVGDTTFDGLVVGNDKLDGGAGSDHILGLGGSDTLVGGPDDDIIDANAFETSGSQDTIRAGSGIDEVQAIDGFKDIISCGTGSDHAFVDAGLDKVSKDCELVSTPQ